MTWTFEIEIEARWVALAMMAPAILILITMATTVVGDALCKTDHAGAICGVVIMVMFLLGLLLLGLDNVFRTGRSAPPAVQQQRDWPNGDHSS